MKLEQYYSPVQSVNGEQGNVVINATKVGLGAYSGTTPTSLPISDSTRVALARKATSLYTLTELRNAVIEGNQTVFLTEKDREGFWYWDSTDTTSIDNTGTVVVAANQRRYKRYNDGTILSSWFTQDNQGFQAFVDASENKSGIINKSISLSSTITLRAGNLEQFSGVTVTTSAFTGFIATDINLNLRNLVWLASSSNNTFLNLSGGRVEFHNCEFKDWRNNCLVIANTNLFIETLKLTGYGAIGGTGRAFVTTNVQNSFINDLIIQNYGDRALDCTGGQNTFFSNLFISDSNGLKPVYLTNTFLYTFLNVFIANNSLVNSIVLSNNSILRFTNASIASDVEVTSANTNVIFNNTRFVKSYKSQYDAFRFTDVIFGSTYTHAINAPSDRDESYVTNSAEDEPTKADLNNLYGTYKAGSTAFYPALTNGAKKYTKLTSTNTSDWGSSDLNLVS